MTLTAYILVTLCTLLDLACGVAIGVLIPHSVKKLARTPQKPLVTQKLGQQQVNTGPVPTQLHTR